MLYGRDGASSRILLEPPLRVRLQELRLAAAHPARRAGVRLRGARVGARGGRRPLRRERAPDLRAVVVRAERVHHGPRHEDGQAALAEQGARRERADVPRHAALPRDRVRLHRGAGLALPPRPEDRARRRATRAAERAGADHEERQPHRRTHVRPRPHRRPSHTPSVQPAGESRGGRWVVLAAIGLFLAAAVLATAPAIRHARTDFLAGGAARSRRGGGGRPSADGLSPLAAGEPARARHRAVARPVLLPSGGRSRSSNPAAWPFGLPFWPLWRALGVVVGWNVLVLLGLLAAGLLDIPLAARARRRGQIGRARSSAGWCSSSRRTGSSSRRSICSASISILLPLALWTFERARRGSALVARPVRARDRVDTGFGAGAPRARRSAVLPRVRARPDARALAARRARSRRRGSQSPRASSSGGS